MAQRASPPARSAPEPARLDYRFSLANERTFLAWTRTALALVAGGVAAAKALNFDSEFWRWIVAAPPLVAGGLLAFQAPRRWRRYEETMRSGGALPVGRGSASMGVALGVYAVAVLAASLVDG